MVQMHRPPPQQLLHWCRFVCSAIPWDPGSSSSSGDVFNLICRSSVCTASASSRTLFTTDHSGVHASGVPTTLRRRINHLRHRRFSYLWIQIQIELKDFDVIWSSSEDLLVIWLLV
jgi:hypothetical protein